MDHSAYFHYYQEEELTFPLALSILFIWIQDPCGEVYEDIGVSPVVSNIVDAVQWLHIMLAFELCIINMQQ